MTLLNLNGLSKQDLKSVIRLANDRLEQLRLRRVGALYVFKRDREAVYYICTQSDEGGVYGTRLHMLTNGNFTITSRFCIPEDAFEVKLLDPEYATALQNAVGPFLECARGT